MAGRDWTFRPEPGVCVRLPGAAFGDARQLYCRRAYAARPGFAPARGESIVDLGANQGLFSVLAAAAGARRVVAVEAQRRLGALLTALARANGVAGRIELVNARVGAGDGGVLPGATGRRGDSRPGAVPELTVTELLDRYNLPHVDLLRIDLDGSEFALFDEPGWLDRVGRIVMRLHPEQGDPALLQRVLAEHGLGSILLDGGLAPTPTLLRAPSGYLYAHRHLTPPRPRAERRPAATVGTPGGAA
jgi:FkbM family methyltransferase